MANDPPRGGDQSSLAQLFLPLLGILTLLAGLVTRHSAPLVSSRPEEAITAAGMSTTANPKSAIPAPPWGPGVPGKMFEDPLNALDRLDLNSLDTIESTPD